MSDSKVTTGKLRWSLLPWEQIQCIVEAFESGLSLHKYKRDSWQYAADDTREKYFDALIRHVKAWYCGERDAPDTGLNHLAHAGACLLILLWHDQNGTWGSKS